MSLSFKPNLLELWVTWLPTLTANQKGETIRSNKSINNSKKVQLTGQQTIEKENREKQQNKKQTQKLLKLKWSRLKSFSLIFNSGDTKDVTHSQKKKKEKSNNNAPNVLNH